MQVGPQENWRAGEPSREAAGGGGEDEAVREEKGWSLEVFGAQLSAQAGWEGREKWLCSSLRAEGQPPSSHVSPDLAQCRLFQP